METTTEQAWNDTEKMKNNAAGMVKEGQAKINQYTERVASKTPFLLFGIAALVSIAVSATLQMRGKRQWSMFIGQWAPSFLLFGLYNKMIKSLGAD